jgi:vancomycin permeability regulator SanA
MIKGIKILAVILSLSIVLVFGMSAYVSMTTSRNIAGTDSSNGIFQESIDECKSIEPQCILVLGCAVWENNQPSPMLRDRLDTAIELYNKGAAPKLLLSGDNSIKEYSEPDCMLAYALKQGVPAEDIFLDFAGFSTYESVYRAHAVFKVDRAIIVTQKYHLYRALKACDALGITAKGVASNQRKYAGRFFREAREILARDKDLVKGLIKAKPTFLGDEIPVEGDGTVTHLNSSQDAFEGSLGAE